ncbi:copper chaperone PCu(A)C [Chelatococcus sp. GCM10030263]|uniref:copper chaperone PCu(A)C n=1 Tax=Chelatococcus sp. GCM10030263 TaxID=3273387 RepID=UPI0036230EF9
MANLSQSVLTRPDLGRIGVSRRRPETLGAAVLALLLMAAPAFAHEFKLGNLEIKHPWSRAIPVGAKVAGGYFVVVNHGATPDRLVAATAEIAGRAEIHEMSTKDGVMTMRPQPDGLPVPANGELALKPGSYHLMLLDLKRPPKQGESFAGTLTFEKAGKVNVTFAVEAIGSSPGDHDHKAMGH